MQPKVVYWNNMPSPYVVGRFNALARRAPFAFEAWFDRPRDPDRSWDVDQATWEFPARYLSGPDGARRVPRAELIEVRPDLLVSLFAERHFALGSLMARSLGARTAFRVLPTFDAWIQRRAAKEAAKHYLFRTVDAAKVPGPDGARVARKYGIPSDRIFPVTQSVDVAHYASGGSADARDRARSLRALLPPEGPQFVCVGRLWKGKGLDYLLDAFERLVRTHPTASLLLIGDGVDEAEYRRSAATIRNVAFAGFVQPVDLPAYYHEADVLVFSTLGDPHGLVVEEAMAAGLPVISTTAAGDIRLRLPYGEAGLIVPPADSGALADAMLHLATHQDDRRRMGGRARELVATRTHEHWAVDFERFVERTLRLPRRRAPAASSAVVAGRMLSFRRR